MSKALIIVDMCKGFVNEKVDEKECVLFMPRAESLITKINRYIKKSLDPETDYVVHVNDSHRPSDHEIRKVGLPEHCMWDTEETENAAGFSYNGVRKANFYKHTYSGFDGTPLEVYLRKRSIEKIIICGVATDVCVFYTAMDGARLGFDVTVERMLTEPLERYVAENAMRMLEIYWGVKVNYT